MYNTAKNMYKISHSKTWTIIDVEIFKIFKTTFRVQIKDKTVNGNV